MTKRELDMSRIATVVVLLALSVVPWHGAQAYTYKVLSEFCAGGSCGFAPEATLVLDKAGNLYGTTYQGGVPGNNNGNTTPGTAFELSPPGWGITKTLKFCDSPSCYLGGFPARDRFTYAGASSGKLYDGVSTLYGATTFYGAASCTDCGSGSIYGLTPTADHASWTVTLVHTFPRTTSGAEGFATSGVVMDRFGNLFGVRGYSDLIYELTPPAKAGGSWVFRPLYIFCSKANCADGKLPPSTPIIDNAGNLYGVTLRGGNGSGDTSAGTVYKLSPPTTKGGAWVETVLHVFCLKQDTCPDGSSPIGALVMDGRGNLYGTTQSDGQVANSSGGTVFKLAPPAAPSGTWTYTVLHDFNGKGAPMAALIIDNLGNLYGTTTTGGVNSSGTIFELTPPAVVGGQWIYKDLHDFGAEGNYPVGGLVMGPAGNIYGTTVVGGLVVQARTSTTGTVFELVK
jgi:uncharacterized repeat protein (TIGR03803 family)